MSPQLKAVFQQAKQLNHAEQLALINHLVNHALPLAPAGPEVIREELLEEVTASVDPQCAEFLEDLTEYQQNHPRLSQESL